MQGVEGLHDQLNRTHNVHPVCNFLRQKRRAFSALWLPGRTDMNALQRGDHLLKAIQNTREPQPNLRIHAVRGPTFSDGRIPSRELKLP